jgi:hypothetical protein
MKHLRRSAVVAVIGVIAIGVSIAGALVAGASNVTNPTSAGYTGSVADGFTAATATMAIPATIQCPVSGYSDAQISSNWYAEQLGAQYPWASLIADLKCANGGLSLTATAAIYDDNGFAGMYLPISAGDVLATRFSYNPTTGIIKLIARNVTQAKLVTVSHKELGLTWDSVDYTWDMYQAPLPTVSTIVFSNLTVNAMAVDAPVNPPASLTGEDQTNGAKTVMVTSPFVHAGNKFHITQFLP